MKLPTPPELRDVVGAVVEGVAINIKYAAHEDKGIHPGEVLRPGEAAHPPEVHWAYASIPQSELQRRMFTLLMVDPDAPDPHHPTNAQWLHWAVVNIPGSNIREGWEVAPYEGPSPPQVAHRFVFLLYEQHPCDRVEAKSISHRSRFNAAVWAAEQNLGVPVAVTYFIAAPGR